MGKGLLYLMEPEELMKHEHNCVRQLKEAQDNPDLEDAHGLADKALVEFLSNLGYRRVVNEYHLVRKRYS